MRTLTNRLSFLPLALVGALLGGLAWTGPGVPSHHEPREAAKARAGAVAQQRRAPCFVPNLGQWQHPARFVHRAGPMTLFLQDRGWVVDLAQKVRGAALRMTFEGDAYVPRIVGEAQLPGHHNYFLGKDASQWRTSVPLYGSVRYEDLYPGIDLRLREVNGVPEYDLLLQPGADLSRVTVQVEGTNRLSIGTDGCLVMETPVGPLTQPRPKTWQVEGDGGRREVPCEFTLLGADRFGFVAPDWDRRTTLTIDPGLIWSTFLGGSGREEAYAVAVDASGVVTVAGWTGSNFPTTTGAYDRTRNGGGWDVFVSRLDPSKTGSAQLLFSTFLGGTGSDYGQALSVDAGGVITVAGRTTSTDFPTTAGAYDTTRNGGTDAFVSRLDPSKTGSAQLLFSTYLGGNRGDSANGLAVGADGVVTVAGYTISDSFPTTSGAYDTTHSGSNADAFVSRLDPSKTGSAQLVYSTFLGGVSNNQANAVAVDASGVVTVAGNISFSGNGFPTTNGAYATSFAGGVDGFVSRLDPSKTGNAQLLYSTFLGASSGETLDALAVDAGGIVTVAGRTASSTFPTTNGAYDRTYGDGVDAYVSRLDPSKTGSAQLVYSTFLGGSGWDQVFALAADGSGTVTAAGYSSSTDFPTTSGAYDTTHNGSSDAFVVRLNPRRTGSAQLAYSTFLGGNGSELARALAVDPSGVATVAGYTFSAGFPTTSGAFDTTHNDGGSERDVFVTRVGMGVALYGDVHEISVTAGGIQKLTVNAGPAHRNREYWIFGSLDGTTPGVTLGSLSGPINVPLNPDFWTSYTIAFPNSTFLRDTKGKLDASGRAEAAIVIPKQNLRRFAPVVFHHAYLIYGGKDCFTASNAVPLKLVR